MSRRGRRRGHDGLGLDEDGRQRLAGCDVVIHSAATVSLRLPPRRRRRGQPARPVPRRRGHRRDGPRTSTPAPRRRVDLLRRRQPPGRGPRGAARTRAAFTVDVDWRAEVERGPARRAATPRPSPARPSSWPQLRQGRPAASSAPPAPPARAEDRAAPRATGSATQLVDGRPGPGRTRSGWPDAYAYTKALGERALVEPSRRACPSPSCARRSSSRRWPSRGPGWIRGFRMAEPVIISYARGLLQEFPGVPEGIVDVIPVDLVVAAIIAVAADGPEPRAGPTVYHVASGVRNPLRYRRLVDLVAGLVQPSTRSTTTDGQPIVVPEWSFPGPGPGAAPARAGRRGHGPWPRRCSLPCRSGASRRELAARSRSGTRWPSGPWLRRALRRLHRVRGASTGSTACSRCGTALDADDQAALRLRPGASSTGTTTSATSTCPRCVEHARVRTTPGQVDRRQPARPGLRRPILSPDRHLAAFDLENTLIASNVVDSYAWLATPPPAAAPSGLRFVADLVRRGPVAARPRPPGPRRLPALLLPPLRGRPGRPAATRTRGSCSPT